MTYIPVLVSFEVCSGSEKWDNLGQRIKIRIIWKTIGTLQVVTCSGPKYEHDNEQDMSPLSSPELRSQQSTLLHQIFWENVAILLLKMFEKLRRNSWTYPFIWIYNKTYRCLFWDPSSIQDREKTFSINAAKTDTNNNKSTVRYK